MGMTRAEKKIRYNELKDELRNTKKELSILEDMDYEIHSKKPLNKALAIIIWGFVFFTILYYII
jgi:hypothetical protein